MRKEILIDIFKSKAFEGGFPANFFGKNCDTSSGVGFEFFYEDLYVSIGIYQSKKKFYIEYELVNFEITKKEYQQLKLIHKKEEAKARQSEYDKSIEQLMDIYRQDNQRKTLIEKTITKN